MMTLDPAISLVLRLTLAALFTAALAHKLGDPRAFRSRVLAYRMLPRRLASAGVGVVVGCEAAVVGAMLLPAGFRFGAVVVLGLLALYSSAIAVNLVRGRRDLDCGCLGRAGARGLRAALLVRNAVLAGAPAALLLPVAERSLVWPDAIGVVGAVTTLALLAMATDVLMTTWPAHAALRNRLRRSR